MNRYRTPLEWLLGRRDQGVDFPVLLGSGVTQRGHAFVVYRGNHVHFYKRLRYLTYLKPFGRPVVYQVHCHNRILNRRTKMYVTRFCDIEVVVDWSAQITIKDIKAMIY